MVDEGARANPGERWRRREKACVVEDLGFAGRAIINR